MSDAALAPAPVLDQGAAPVALASTALPSSGFGSVSGSLPGAIRRHREDLLGAVFGPLGGDGPDGQEGMSVHLAGLLARLERVLEARDDRDEKAFRAGFLEMVPRLHKFAMSLTKNPTQADDLVQDTLMRGWRSRARFETGTNLGAWLFTIMRNAFYSMHRKHHQEVSDSDGNLAERVATIPEQGGHLDVQDAQAALARLPVPMRQALILVAIENLSYEEAAAAMNCRIGTVKSRVWRAREQLALILGYNTAEIGSDALTLSAMGDVRMVGG